MERITLEEFLNDARHAAQVATVLKQEGLVCFPCRGTYRIAASLLSETAVLALLQVKRRSRRKPALVLLPDARALDQLASEIPPGARKLMRELWPGALTIRLPIRREAFPDKVYRELSKPDRKLGFRLADGPVARTVAQQAALPLLVSSANLSQKVGATSVAAIRKNFSRSVELLVDCGDLPQGPPSTVVDFDGDGYRMVRAGLVTEEQIARACAA